MFEIALGRSSNRGGTCMQFGHGAAGMELGAYVVGWG